MMRLKWTARSALVALVLLGAAGGSSGCRVVRGAADRGHRILDRDGLPPAKLAGYFGAAAGYTVGLPLMVVLLPTYPFERLDYRPEGDIEVPRLFAPVEVGGGLGAFITGGPFTLFRRGEDAQRSSPSSTAPSFGSP